MESSFPKYSGNIFYEYREWAKCVSPESGFFFNLSLNLSACFTVDAVILCKLNYEMGVISVSQVGTAVTRQTFDY